MTDDTLAKILQANGRGPLAGRDAMREKEYGIWQTVTWAEYAEEVRRFALGLAKLGFGRGDKLAVIGDNRRRLYFAQLAAQSLGGISLAVYQDSIATELGYVLEHAETKVIVAENEEQVDKVFEIRDRLGNVEKVVFDDPRGLELVDDLWLAYFPDVQAMGDEFDREHPDFFDRELAAGKGADTAMLCYTSGTTGAPQGSDAHQRQPALVRRGVEGGGRLADRGRAHRLPADGLGGRLVALGRGRDLLRSHHQLPGESRDHPARLPGDRGDRHGRAARLLGGDADPHPGPDGRGRLAEARVVPSIHGRRGARGTDAAGRGRGCRRASRPPTRWASGSFAAPCGTSSA